MPLWLRILGRCWPALILAACAGRTQSTATVAPAGATVALAETAAAARATTTETFPPPPTASAVTVTAIAVTATAIEPTPRFTTRAETAWPDSNATPEVRPARTASATAIAPISTSSPPPTARPTATGPPPVLGLGVEEIAVVPPTVQENLRQIYARGQNLGRNPYRFSKLGDSTILKPLLLARFDEGGFDLGPYAHLQPVINYYAGSYERVGLAAREALHSWSIFDPLWANKTWCEPNETMLECEFRYNNPAILIVRLGSNDSGAPTGFAANLRQVIQFALDQGIIPVLATKADRFEGEENTNNEIIRRTAREFQLPLWEFDRVADHLPGRGLGEDGIHLVVDDRLHDYSDPAIMASGHAVQNLTALMTLAEVWEAVNAEQP